MLCHLTGRTTEKHQLKISETTAAITINRAPSMCTLARLSREQNWVARAKAWDDHLVQLEVK
jgi:hypothetical protein